MTRNLGVEIEEHRFVLADFTPDRIVLSFFRWNVKEQPVEEIGTLQPFRVTELTRE